MTPASSIGVYPYSSSHTVELTVMCNLRKKVGDDYVNIDPLKQFVANVRLREKLGHRSLLMFDYTDYERRDLMAPAERLFHKGDFIGAILGYDEDFEERGPFQISVINSTVRGDAVILHIEAESALTSANTIHRRVFSDVAAIDLIERFLFAYKLRGEFLSDIPREARETTCYVQTGSMSDFEFIQMVSVSAGLKLTVQDETAIFSNADGSTPDKDTASRLDTFFVRVGGAEGTVDEFQFIEAADDKMHPNMKVDAEALVNGVLDTVTGLPGAIDRALTESDESAAKKAGAVDYKRLGAANSPEKVVEKARPSASADAAEANKAAENKVPATDPYTVPALPDNNDPETFEVYDALGNPTGMTAQAGKKWAAKQASRKHYRATTRTGVLRIRPTTIAYLDLGGVYDGPGTVTEVDHTFYRSFKTEFTASVEPIKDPNADSGGTYNASAGGTLPSATTKPATGTVVEPNVTLRGMAAMSSLSAKDRGIGIGSHVGGPSPSPDDAERAERREVGLRFIERRKELDDIRYPIK